MSDVGLVSSTEVCRRTGITYRQLDYWCRIGVLEPMVPADGPGSQRLFTEREVEVVATLHAVLNVDFTSKPRGTVSALRDLVEHVRAHGPTGHYELAPGILMDLDAFIPKANA